MTATTGWWGGERAGASAALALGAAAGIGAVLVVLAPRHIGLLLFAVALLAVVVVLTADLRRVLLALIAVDLFAQLDVSLGYREEPGSLGAHGGIEFSVTTLALIGLYLHWGWASVRPRHGTRHSAMQYWAPFALYVGMAAFSVGVASDVFLAVSWVLFLLEALLLLIYLAHALQEPGLLRTFLSWIFMAAAVEGLIITVEWLTHSATFFGVPLSHWPYPPEYYAANRPGGTLGSPNTASAVLSVFLAVAVGVVLSQLAGLVRWSAFAALASGLPALLATATRGGWMAFAIGITVVVIVSARRGWLTPRFFAMSGVAGTAGFILFGPLILKRAFGDDGGSGASRGELNEIAWRVIAENPIRGVGADNYALVLPERLGPQDALTWIYTVHNDYLLVWAELGAIGLLAYAFFLVSVVLSGIRAIRAPVGSLLAPVLVATTGALAGRLLHMTIDLFNGRPQLHSLMVLVALLVAAATFVSDRGPVRPRAVQEVR